MTWEKIINTIKCGYGYLNKSDLIGLKFKGFVFDHDFIKQDNNVNYNLGRENIIEHCFGPPIKLDEKDNFGNDIHIPFDQILTVSGAIYPAELVIRGFIEVGEILERTKREEEKKDNYISAYPEETKKSQDNIFQQMKLNYSGKKFIAPEKPIDFLTSELTQETLDKYKKWEGATVKVEKVYPNNTIKASNGLEYNLIDIVNQIDEIEESFSIIYDKIKDGDLKNLVWCLFNNYDPQDSLIDATKKLLTIHYESKRI